MDLVAVGVLAVLERLDAGVVHELLEASRTGRNRPCRHVLRARMPGEHLLNAAPGQILESDDPSQERSGATVGSLEGASATTDGGSVGQLSPVKNSGTHSLKHTTRLLPGFFWKPHKHSVVDPASRHHP